MKFEPISYDHAARLIGRRPWDVSRDAELLASAHHEAMKTYGCDGCIVGLDIYNVEIEAYGCEIIEPDENGVPVAGEPIFSEVGEFMSLQLDPSGDGRIPMVLQAAQRIAEKNPDAEVRIPLSGPFTIACHLLGIENMICELFTNPEPTVTALMHLADNQLRYGRVAVEMGFKVSLFESSVTPPLLSPQLFSDKVLPSLNKILTGLNRSSQSDFQLIIGGDTIHVLDAISSLSPSYIICPFETDQEQFMSRVTDNQQMKIRINMDPSVFLPGNNKAAITEAKRVFDIARRYRNTSIGTLIPFEADSRIISEVSSLIESSQQTNSPDAYTHR
jgi:uroporphyrinogen decarboxylase